MNHRREHASKEETLSKTTPALCLHNVTTTDLLLALADACDVMLWIHHPIHRDGSIFFLLHHQTGDFDIAMKQSRYDILKLESALALKFVCYPKCSCVVQVIIKRHGSVVTSSNWVRCSPDCTSFAEMESRWFGCSRASAAWSRPRLGTSRSSTSPSRSPSTRCLSEDSSQLPSKWPERYHAVMISARAVRQYAHLPGSVSQFLHQLTYHEEGIFSIFTICEEGVFSRFPLIYSHFHSRLLTTSEKSKISSENFLQPPKGQQSKSCRRWTPPSAVRLPPYHEKASVSCAFCLNMTFLVNKGR